MKTQVTFVFLAAILVGGLLSSCYVAQPPFECTPASTDFVAKYDLISGTDGGACAAYPGDLMRIQKYQAPGDKTATIAVLSKKMGLITRVKNADTGVFARVDPNDPNYQKESARGPLTSLAADKKGVCSATLAPAEQDLPPVQVHTADFVKDGGVKNYPRTVVKYEWKNFRFLNTARFPGTVVSGQLDVTLNNCSASYNVEAIWAASPTTGGPVECDPDNPVGPNEDCNPNANLDAGRVTGSGLSSDYKPVCGSFGFCVPTVSLDDLAKLE